MLTNPKVTYFIKQHDGVIEVWSKVPTDFGGAAQNFVVEKDTVEGAEALIEYLESLAR